MTKKKEAVSEQGRGERGKIIILPLAKAPEPFLEEINTVRLEGRYFAFDPKRANAKPARQEFKDGERKLEIVVHPQYGHPSVLAYRILQHVYLKITKEGKPFPDVVSFSYREIGRLIGRDLFGGRDLHQIENAIKQLRTTEVIETTTSEKKNKTHLYQNKHDATSLSFEKDYETTCAEWFGGLKPWRYKADIERQLKPHFDALKHSGLIKSAEIVRRIKGSGFKIVFRPGKGFFRDYDHFYLGKSTRILQFERAADEAKVQRPLRHYSLLFRTTPRPRQSRRPALCRVKEFRILLEQDDVGLNRWGIPKWGEI